MSRMPKVNVMLQEKISEIIAQKIEMPYDFFVTLSGVSCAPDLKTARVYISVLPIDKADQAVNFLNNRQREIQKFMAKNWRLKFLPTLSFYSDDTEEFAQGIYRTLDEISE